MGQGHSDFDDGRGPRLEPIHTPPTLTLLPLAIRNNIGSSLSFRYLYVRRENKLELGPLFILAQEVVPVQVATVSRSRRPQLALT